MSKDYRRKSKKKTSPSPVRWLLSGFGLGLIAAFAMYFLMKPTSDVQVAEPSRTTQPQSISDEDDPAPTNVAKENAATPADTLPALPAQGDSNYEFYDVLPGFVVEVPEVQTDEDRPKPGSRPPSTRTPTTAPANTSYMLQTGSFRSHADADRRKAEIGLIGFSSTIQEVTIKGDNWFRVYVGPTRDKEQLEYTRSRLRRDGIDALLLREKPE